MGVLLALRTNMVSSIHEIDVEEWDRLSEMRPFQSHRWYTFGEEIMADCLPTYLLVYNENELVARAAFWLIKNEPLPDLQPALRTLVMFFLKRWPLFICRSPLSNATGLIIAKGIPRAPVLSALCQSGIQEAISKQASFVVFDYLEENETNNWPELFSVVQVSDPEAVMSNHWESLYAFLSEGNKKDRQHYKRTVRETEKLGIQLERYRQIPDVESALQLIHNVDKRYGNTPNPWMRNLLLQMNKIGGTWLEARLGGRLVGGGLILEDNRTQMTTALGLAEDVPFVYFRLLYECLEIGFEKNVALIRWGSGAYEVKKRLGSKLKFTNNAVFAPTNRFIGKVVKIILSK
ncbi:MAG TPA: hypothetical protein DCX54_05800 [Flavobacteriales bacterium]|nr:hypothetical protein [Flavobacteriales bacterium]